MNWSRLHCSNHSTDCCLSVSLVFFQLQQSHQFYILPSFHGHHWNVRHLRMLHCHHCRLALIGLLHRQDATETENTNHILCKWWLKTVKKQKVGSAFIYFNLNKWKFVIIKLKTGNYKLRYGSLAHREKKYHFSHLCWKYLITFVFKSTALMIFDFNQFIPSLSPLFDEIFERKCQFIHLVRTSWRKSNDLLIIFVCFVKSALNDNNVTYLPIYYVLIR